MPSESNASGGGVVGVVMAAGIGSRFGSDKRRARLPDGRTLLATTLATVSPAFSRCFLVLRPQDEIEHLLGGAPPPGVEPLTAPHAAAGLAASLGDAFRQLLERGAIHDARAAAVLLGDMPWLQVRTCHALVAQAASDRIVVPRCDDRSGHPVLFGRDFWTALAALTTGEGARTVVSAHRSAVQLVETDDAGIWRDVDRPGDLSTR
ncbi:nucleotidyltransferase family protein [Salinicola avicenniae]|uniref:nucleotidyltransferase family protein n=1 Tax=Salinicola avicenniae TaxID=2916836 RepID=UPI002072DB35|nr:MULTISPECIES: nucleotidyltransferase family protein [unclassified Salinicola]